MEVSFTRQLTYRAFATTHEATFTHDKDPTTTSVAGPQEYITSL